LFLLAHIIVLTILLNWLWLTNILDTLVMSGPAAVVAGPKGLYKRASLAWDIIFFMRLEYVSQLLFWCALWSVKISFLAFFRRLSANVRLYKNAWWIIVTLTGLAFIACVAVYPYPCLAFNSRK
jgi:hypothetical protein